MGPLCLWQCLFLGFNEAVFSSFLRSVLIFFFPPQFNVTVARVQSFDGKPLSAQMCWGDITPCDVMLFQGDFGGVYDGISIESSGCKNPCLCTRRTRSSNVWNWNYTNDQIFYAVGEKNMTWTPYHLNWECFFICLFWCFWAQSVHCKMYIL